jgi:hypothetical protein
MTAQVKTKTSKEQSELLRLLVPLKPAMNERNIGNKNPTKIEGKFKAT